jgi:hypothetical protein
MKKFTLTSVFAIAAVSLSCLVLVVACNRKDKNNTTTTTTTSTVSADDKDYATDQATADNTFDDVQAIADKAMDLSAGGTMSWRTTTACAPTVTHHPDTTIVDFGTVACTGADGRTRKGKIIIVHTGGHYDDSGHFHQIMFDNYFQNGNQITGSKKVTNMGHNSAGNLYFNIDVNGSVIRPSGATLTQVSTRVRTWMAGSGTPHVRTDDIYQITGSGSLTRATAGGASATANFNITAPLEIHGDCHNIEAGTITMTMPSGASRSLNYGNTPVCDNIGVLTLPSGTTTTITLP